MLQHVVAFRVTDTPGCSRWEDSVRTADPERRRRQVKLEVYAGRIGGGGSDEEVALTARGRGNAGLTARGRGDAGQ